jgi:aspartyl protease family protein
MRSILLWLCIFVILIIAYAFKQETKIVCNKFISSIFPSIAYNKNNEIIVSKSIDGHFYIWTKLNGIDVKFLVDTGASDLFISREDARKIGINLTNLSYNKKYSSANGIMFGAQVTIPKFQINSVVFDNVKASVSKNHGNQNLLGMSVIRKFKSFTIDGSALVFEAWE